jgi:hypothetical protein
MLEKEEYTEVVTSDTNYSEAITIEISKGRTFEQILSEEPSEFCSSTELHAWLDAGEIANKGKEIPNTFKSTKRKITIIELSLVVIISAMLVSPFIVSNNLFLLLNIPLGILVGTLGRLNTKLSSSIEIKRGIDELYKHLMVKGYTKRTQLKEFVLKLILTPFQVVCVVCETMFPKF